MLVSPLVSTLLLPLLPRFHEGSEVRGIGLTSNAGAREHVFARLEIAMDDVHTMRRRQGLGNLNAVVERLCDCQRTALQSIGERLAFEKLHDEVRVPFVLADVSMLELDE